MTTEWHRKGGATSPGTFTHGSFLRCHDFFKRRHHEHRKHEN